MPQSKIISEFIKKFEKKFGKYLDPVKPRDKYDSDKPEPIFTQYFEILPPKNPKLSDWDIEGRLKDNIEINVLNQIVEFIRSFNSFKSIGFLMTDFELYAALHYFYYKTITHLQFMAFLPEEKNGPFIDFHLNNVNNIFLKTLLTKNASQEFDDWILITNWRKLLSVGVMPYSHWTMLVLDDKSQQQFTSHPKSFIPKYLSESGSQNYEGLIKYFNQVS